jgi:hypothetical protein
MKYQRHFPVHWLKYFPPVGNAAAMVCPQFVPFATTRVHDTMFADLALNLSVSSEDCKSVNKKLGLWLNV